MIFVFIIFLKQIFLGTRKFVGEQKKFGGNCPRMPTRGCGPASVALDIS